MIKITTKTNLFYRYKLCHVTQKQSNIPEKVIYNSIIKCYLIYTWKLTTLREIHTNNTKTIHKTTQII